MSCSARAASRRAPGSCGDKMRTILLQNSMSRSHTCISNPARLNAQAMQPHERSKQAEPAVSAPPAGSAQPSAAKAAPGQAADMNRPRILIIDDDADFCRTVVSFLTRNNFQVFAAPDGFQGLQAANRQPIDLILCDLDMPGMDGFEVFEALRQDQRLADVPILFLTGRAEPGQVRQGMNLGVDDYLTKPFDAGDLLKAIRVRMERSRSGKTRVAQQIERAMQLFMGIAHDLRDPLSVALAYSELLKQPSNDRAVDPQAMLDRMQKAMLQMQAMLSETIFLARSRMQRIPFEPASLDLVHFLALQAAEHPHATRLQFVAASEKCIVHADPIRLRQVFEHLLSNALKYSDASVTLRVAPTPHGALIEVTDQGIGILESEQARVFEPFFRGSNVENRSGHGLGLCIVKSCVELHGGTLEFTSMPGQRTTFRVHLPAQPPVPQEMRSSTAVAHALATIPPVAAEKTPAGSQAPDSLKICILDDDPLVRSMLVDMLQSRGSGHSIYETSTVTEARSLARDHQFDVAFVDVNLPDASGFELLKELPAKTAVIFMSNADEHAVQAFDCEAVDYLLKPISTERLNKALGRACNRLPSRPAVKPAAQSRLEDSFVVKTMAEKRLVKIREIRNIAAYGEYSWVYWEEGKGAMLRKSLKQWQAELPSEQFVRVHRRAIINLAFLDRIQNQEGHTQLYLKNSQDPIEVSSRLAPQLNRRLKSLGKLPSQT